MFTWYQKSVMTASEIERNMARVRERWEEVAKTFAERSYKYLGNNPDLIPRCPGFTLVKSFEGKGEEVRSLMVFKDKVYVATTKRVGVLKDGVFKSLRFEVENGGLAESYNG